jgi:pimeloyl-ACP methyl ester carboxylesterase
MDDLVADLHGVVEQVAPDGGRVTILGESFGGALALNYALTYQERLARLVIVNSFSCYDARLRLRLGYHLLRAMPWRLMPLMRRLSAWRLHSRQTEMVEVQRFYNLMRTATREGYLSRLSMLREYDLRGRLPHLRVPTMFLASDRDHLVPSLEQATLMARLVPDATIKVLSGHGHICLIAPDLDLATILDEWATDRTRKP